MDSLCPGLSHELVPLLASIFMGGTLTDISGGAAGTVFSIVNVCGTTAVILMGPLTGGLKDHYGWNTIFYLVAVLYVVAAVAFLFINCTQSLVGNQKK